MDSVLLITGLRVVEMMSISLQKKNNYNIEPKVCIRSVFSFLDILVLGVVWKRCEYSKK